MKKLIFSVLIAVSLLGWVLAAYQNINQRSLKKEIEEDILKEAQFLWNKYSSIRDEVQSKQKANDFFAQERFIVDMRDSFINQTNQLQKENADAAAAINQKLDAIVQQNEKNQAKLKECESKILYLSNTLQEINTDITRLESKILENEESWIKYKNQLAGMLKKNSDNFLQKQQDYEERLSEYRQRLDEFSKMKQGYEKQILQYKQQIMEYSNRGQKGKTSTKQ